MHLLVLLDRLKAMLSLHFLFVSSGCLMVAIRIVMVDLLWVLEIRQLASSSFEFFVACNHLWFCRAICYSWCILSVSLFFFGFCCCCFVFFLFFWHRTLRDFWGWIYDGFVELCLLEVALSCLLVLLLDVLEFPLIFSTI